MEKLRVILLSIFCTLTTTLHAQWLTNGNNIYYNSGLVGIGTTGPTNFLHVRGTPESNLLRFENDNSTFNEMSMRLRAKSPSNSNFHADFGIKATSTETGYFFFKAPWYSAERMVIDTDGNVGIGTINPTVKLAVNGTAKAKEVIVTEQASDWPDHIFSGAGYRLPDLRGLEAFIKKHKHLPGIPTKEEVEQNGQNLGVIQAELLEKIEELTLHMIDQQKKIKYLEAEVRKFKSNN